MSFKVKRIAQPVGHTLRAVALGVVASFFLTTAPCSVAVAGELAEQTAEVIGPVFAGGSARLLKVEEGTIYLVPSGRTVIGYGSVLKVERVSKPLIDPTDGSIVGEISHTIGYAAIDNKTDTYLSGSYLMSAMGVRPLGTDRIGSIRKTGRVAVIWQGLSPSQIANADARLTSLLSAGGVTLVARDEVTLFEIEQGLAPGSADAMSGAWRNPFMKKLRADVSAVVRVYRQGEYDVAEIAVYVPDLEVPALVRKKLITSMEAAPPVAPPVTATPSTAIPPPMTAAPLREAGLQEVMRFDHPLVAALFADTNGDGNREFVYAGHNQVFIRSSMTGSVIWESPIWEKVKVASMMAADLNGDGAEEVFVNCTDGEMLKSKLITGGGGWQVSREGMPLYFSGNDHGDILAQKIDPPRETGSFLLRVGYDGRDLSFTSVLLLGKKPPLGLTYLSTDPVRLAGINIDNRLEVYSDIGRRLSKSSSDYGGSNRNVAILPVEAYVNQTYDGDVPDYMQAGPKPLPVASGAGSLIAVPVNSKEHTFVDFGEYVNGFLVLIDYSNSNQGKRVFTSDKKEGEIFTALFSDPSSPTTIYAVALVKKDGEEALESERGKIYRLNTAVLP